MGADGGGRTTAGGAARAPGGAARATPGGAARAAEDAPILGRKFDHFTFVSRERPYKNKCTMAGCDAIIANPADACAHHNHAHRMIAAAGSPLDEWAAGQVHFHQGTTLCRTCWTMVIVQPNERAMVKDHGAACANFTKLKNKGQFDLGSAGTWQRMTTPARLDLGQGRAATMACFYNACQTSGASMTASALHTATFALLRDPSSNSHVQEMVTELQMAAAAPLVVTNGAGGSIVGVVPGHVTFQGEGMPSPVNWGAYLDYAELTCNASTAQGTAAAEALQRCIEVYSDGAAALVYGLHHLAKGTPIRIWHNGLFEHGHYEGMRRCSTPPAAASLAATVASPTSTAPGTSSNHQGQGAGSPAPQRPQSRGMPAPPPPPPPPPPPSNSSSTAPSRPPDPKDPAWTTPRTFSSVNTWATNLGRLFSFYADLPNDHWEDKRKIATMILDRPRNATIEKKRAPASAGEDSEVRRALMELDDNRIGRANRALAAAGVAEDSPEVRAKITSKYPRDCALPPPTGSKSAKGRDFVLQGVPSQEVRAAALASVHKGTPASALTQLQLDAINNPLAPPNLHCAYVAARENAGQHVQDGVSAQELPSYLYDATTLSEAEWGAKYPTRSQADAPGGYGRLVTDTVEAQLRPSPSAAPTPPEATTAARVAVSVTTTELYSYLRSRPKLTGGGADGWNYAQLRLLCDFKYAKHSRVHSGKVLQGLTDLANDLASGNLASLAQGSARALRDRLTHARGVAIYKSTHSHDVRPIGIGEVFVSLAAGALLRTETMRKLVPEAVGPTEMGNGVRGGVESLPNSVRAYLLLHPDHVVIKTDIANAFNSLHRALVVAAANIYHPLSHLITLMYGAYSTISYGALRIEVQRGVNQGDPMGPVLYSTASRPAVDATMQRHPSVRITGIMDDKYIMGPAEEALMAVETYAAELAKLGLQLQHSKSAAIHGTALTPAGGTAGSYAKAAAACKLHNIDLVQGISVGGAPVGTKEYVHRELSGLVEDLVGHMGKVREAITHQSTLSGTGPSANLRSGRLYKLIRWCLAPAMLSYTLRTTPAEDMEDHSTWYDKEVFKVVLDLLGVPGHHPHVNDSTAAGRLVRDRVHLHAEGGGLNITSAAQTAHDARLGNILLTAHLVAQALGEGFDSTTQGSDAIPDLPRLLQAKETKALQVEKLEGLKVEDAFIAPLHHMSSTLSHARRETRLKAVLNQIEDAEAKAWALSCGGEGAHYLLAEDSSLAFGVRPLPNDLFKALGRARVGLQPAPYPASASPAAAPAPPAPRGDDKCPREGCGMPMGNNGLHHLTCLEMGPGGAKGMRAQRHSSVKKALRDAMRKLGGEKTVPLPEPDLCTLWLEKDSYRARRAAPQQASRASQPTQPATPAASATSQPMQVEGAEGGEALHATQPGSLPPGPSQLLDDLPEEAAWHGQAALNWHNKPRGDISWRSKDGTVVFDLVITHPLPRSCAAVATAAGTAAHKAHSDKINKYSRRFEIPGGAFEPIAVETGGRLHPESRRAIKTFIKHSLGIDEEAPMPPDLAYKYSQALRTVLDSLAVALAGEVALALLSGGPGGARAPARARVRDQGGGGDPAP